MYIGHAGQLIFRYNWSHNAKVGYLVKSRAATNYILYNRLTGETPGTTSYEIDLPNGGTSYVIGNLIEQSKNTGNQTMLTYMEEGLDSRNPNRDLHVVNNTFVNERRAGAIFIRPAATADPAQATNNIFNGPGTICTQATAVLATNFAGDPLFADAANFDYHLLPGSPAIDAGSDAGALTPKNEYVHPTCGETRNIAGAAIDIGAYEFGGAGAPFACR